MSLSLSDQYKDDMNRILQIFWAEGGTSDFTRVDQLMTQVAKLGDSDPAQWEASVTLLSKITDFRNYMDQLILASKMKDNK